KRSLEPTLGFYMDINNSRIGVATQDLNVQLGQYFGIESGGVLVTSVHKNGPADKAGFKAGDCIIELNGKAIVDKSNFRKELNKIKSGEARFTVLRDRQPMELLITIAPKSN